MKILLLADVNSPHTIRWVKALNTEGLEIGVFSMAEPKNDLLKKLNIPVYTLASSSQKLPFNLHKLQYFSFIQSLKKVIKNFSPDIIHAHYATSYGMLGAFSGFHPLVVSVWGSDIISFPKKSLFHKLFLKQVLKKADSIMATSNYLGNEVQALTNRSPLITPFGVDLQKFCSDGNKTNSSTIVIGTIKSLEKIYGIDILIKAFNKLEDEVNRQIKLLIVGSGSEENNLKDLVSTLRLSDDVTFAGKIAEDDVVNYHRQIDVFVNVSQYESFGVSVIEASACGTPVIASNVGGLKEVVVHNETGILVPSNDVNALKEAMKELIEDSSLRKLLGSNGRNFVMKNYNLAENVKIMVNEYKRVLEKHS